MVTDVLVRGCTVSFCYESTSSADAQLCWQLYLLTASMHSALCAASNFPVISIFRKHIYIQHI